MELFGGFILFAILCLPVLPLALLVEAIMTKLHKGKGQKAPGMLFIVAGVFTIPVTITGISVLTAFGHTELAFAWTLIWFTAAACLLLAQIT